MGDLDGGFAVVGAGAGELDGDAVPGGEGGVFGGAGDFSDGAGLGDVEDEDGLFGFAVFAGEVEHGFPDFLFGEAVSELF